MIIDIILDRFNPRTPCGVRLAIIDGGNPGNEFQSTHSLRSATRLGDINYLDGVVSIHALLAECDWNRQLACLPLAVSIHALLAECDRNRAGIGDSIGVSIHALLAECDSFGFIL